jgi:hypothetical protein
LSSNWQIDGAAKRPACGIGHRKSDRQIVAMPHPDPGMRLATNPVRRPHFKAERVRKLQNQRGEAALQRSC